MTEETRTLIRLSQIIYAATATVAQDHFISENAMADSVKKTAVGFIVVQQASAETTSGSLTCISLIFQMEIFFI